MMRAIDSPTYTFVERRRDEFFKGISGLRDQDLWWYAAHVADFNTAFICVGGNDDRLIQQITNWFFHGNSCGNIGVCSTWKTKVFRSALQRTSSNQEKNSKSILLGTFNNCFRGLGELMKNIEKNEVDDVHYNHWPIHRCIKQFFHDFKQGNCR